jgi:hypothetical protein
MDHRAGWPRRPGAAVAWTGRPASRVTAMRDSRHELGDPVAAADVEQAVVLALAAMGPAVAADWHARAGTLNWDRWETIEHMSDDLFSYAAQLGPRNPPLTAPVPFGGESRRAGGPAGAIFADRAAGPAGLMQVFEACGALLAAMVAAPAVYPGNQRPFGVADPQPFAAAMGIAEVLVHTHDVTQGSGTVWAPQDELCRRVLDRLFPDAPDDTEPWLTLLWATGRAELPGHPAVTSWHWYAGPGDG